MSLTMYERIFGYKKKKIGTRKSVLMHSHFQDVGSEINILEQEDFMNYLGTKIFYYSSTLN